MASTEVAAVAEEPRPTKPPAAPSGTQEAQARALSELARLGELGLAAAEVFERVRPSVVEIRTRGGNGAGTIWRADGTIVTSNHVVPWDQAEVRLADGRTRHGTVRARDPYNDLAILSLDGHAAGSTGREASLDTADHGITAATIGDARRLRPGELVLAIGHPFGLRGAVTIGIVHTPLISVAAWGGPRAGRELVLADVLLGPGNSGGPLVDARGRVVGINAMVHGDLALAVPSHRVEALLGMERLQPRLGIEVREVALPPLQAAAAATLGLAHEENRTGAAGVRRGFVILEVEPGSAAERAGLLAGDVLVAVNARPLRRLEELPGALAPAVAHRSGRRLTLGVLRGTTPLTLDVPPVEHERAHAAAARAAA
jgi:serine protease Do